ncbi:hypothetical protein F5B18DRAFT_618806 [Nemania serpens]|nr:hypothetical protein F5B18DRAFT_618806 [Nemania serpens]
MQPQTHTIVAALMAMAATANSHGIMNKLNLLARDGAADPGAYFSITAGAGSSATAGSPTSASSSVPAQSPSPSSSTSASSTGFLTVATSTTTSAATPVVSTTVTSSSTAASSTAVASAAPLSSAPASGPSVLPSPGSGSGTGTQALTGHCTTEGMFNCIDGTSYQQCASGIWSVVQQMPVTTKCAPGQTITLWARDMRIDGRDVLENRRRGY